jgi:hypothetical protein
MRSGLAESQGGGRRYGADIGSDKTPALIACPEAAATISCAP